MTPLLTIACVGAFGAACPTLTDRSTLLRIDPATTSSISIEADPDVMRQRMTEPGIGEDGAARERFRRG